MESCTHNAVPADSVELVGIVVIGRDEGERLRASLRSTRGAAYRVYVDSGSTDDSVRIALAQGIEVVELTPPFTAARARNVGLARLLARYPHLQYVQMLDGDCELRAGWIDTALQALREDPTLAGVFGRRRERHPEQSIYNALCDDEWNVPLGEAAGCGGDALFRVQALRSVSFYKPFMIAGEDSELGMRLRLAGWRLQRIAAEMTLHDAAITHFAQWWHRTRRSGYGFAEMAHLHPHARNPNWPRTVASILVWGGALPVLTLAGIALSLWLDARCWWLVGLLVLVWPVKMAEVAAAQHRRGLSVRVAGGSGVLVMVGKLPQLAGLIRYHCDRLADRRPTLIEYR